MGRAALRRQRQQIELQLKNVKYPADILTCDKTATYTLAPQAAGTTFEDLGKGYCSEASGGVAAGYDDKGTESAEACQTVCLQEADCVHFSHGPSVCLRYKTAECDLSWDSSWWFNQFQTYKKVLPAPPTQAPTEAPIAAGTYRIGVENGNECLSTDVKVTTEEDCEAAATALAASVLPGAAYTGVKSSSKRPGGCYVESNGRDLKFNPTDGGAWKNRDPVCKTIAAATPTEQAEHAEQVSAEQVYQQVVTDVWAYFEGLGDTASQQDYTGCLLRTAGHDFMDFRWTSDGKATGGSDGCINFEDPDNTGIPQCLALFEVAALYKNWCDKVSLGDFLVIIAEAVMARTATSYQADSFESGTLAHTFMSKFEFGRPTVASCAEHVGLMPNPEEGCADLKRVFVDHIYLNSDKDVSWKHTAAISGAHTIGKTNLENSGYNGSWTTNPAVFDNAYYKRILDQGWIPQWNVNGNSGKNQWIVSDLGRDKPEVKQQMMLNSDLCLLFDNSRDSVNCDELILADNAFLSLGPGRTTNVVYQYCNNIRGKGRFVNAKERMCCTWTRPDKMFDTDAWHTADPSDPLAGGNPKLYIDGVGGTHCGYNFTHLSDIGSVGDVLRGQCCDGILTMDGYENHVNRIDCDYPGNTEGPAWNHVYGFAYNETYWLESYSDAWNVATTNVMKYVGSDGHSDFTAGNTGNCGCCKQNTTIWDAGHDVAKVDKMEVHDEGYTECEQLKTEDTYDPSFWNAREGGSSTWPLFNQDESSRDVGSTKYPNLPPVTTEVLDKMELASEAHVLSGLRTELTACAPECEVDWMDNLAFYK
jgi:hypothetical protein